MLACSLPAAHIGSVCRAQHLLRRVHPNDGIVESVSSARGAGGWFARGQMLVRSVRAGLCFCEGRYQTRMAGWGACQFCMRRWQSACQKAHARTGSANRTHRLRMPCAAPSAEGNTRMGGWWNLSVSHATLAVDLSGGKCSPILCGERIRMAEMVESVIPARAAGNQLVSQRMLAQSVPPRTNFLPAQTCYHQSMGYGALPHD